MYCHYYIYLYVLLNDYHYSVNHYLKYINNVYIHDDIFSILHSLSLSLSSSLSELLSFTFSS